MSLDLSSVPLGLILPPTFLAILLTTYSIVSPNFHTDKQRAYILSACSSFTMSIVSLPFVAEYLTGGLETVYEVSQEGWRKELGRVGVLFFGSYLVADLGVGYFRYPSQVGLLTGWIHHIVYISLMLYIYQTRLSPIFLVSAIMELPTFDLAISNLFPRVRSDLRFLSSFFAIRIAFHFVWFLDCLRPSSRAVTDGSWVPASMLAAALVLHVSWFRGGFAGYIKRRRMARKAASAQKVSTTSQTAVSGDIDIVPSLDSTTSLSSSSSTTGGFLTPSNSRTPDDSPLMTPHTPSITPMTLRDSYIYTTVTAVSNGLPTLSIPSIPSLSDFTSAFPPLPMPMGGREFKDAVKHRWEEGRGRFGNMGLGNMGGMGPLLRRRAGRAESRDRETVVRSEE